MTSIDFVDFFPHVPDTWAHIFMLEAMTYKVTVSLPPSLHPSMIQVQAWTSQCDRTHPDGDWHAIDLAYLGQGEGQCYKYGQSEVVTSNRNFEFTFRLRTKSNEAWKWSHGFGENGHAAVEGPRDYDKWTLGPDFTHILGSVHLGNFIAATQAKDCGFTHVLNVAENLDMVYPDGGVVYQKVPMQDGAHHPIDSNRLKEAVDWLIENDSPDHKVLLNCRAGIGRAGSTAVAFVFAVNQSMTYEDAYQFVFDKRFVYPHAGLYHQVHELYPRK